MNLVSHHAIFEGGRLEILITAPALGEHRDEIIKNLNLKN